MTSPVKWRCPVFGYTYDEVARDPDSGVQPGTRDDELPDGWVCPLFGAGREYFELVKE